WVQLGHRGKAILLLPVGRVLWLSENELSAGRVVAEIQPVQYPRVQDPFVDGAARLSCVNTADNEINVRAFLELLNRCLHALPVQPPEEVDSMRQDDCLW